MAAIGNQLTSTSFVVDTFSGTGSQTSFTGLTFSPASTAAIAVHVAGVYQAPSVYSLSGTTLTFSSAPALGTSNIQVLHLGTGATAGVPSDGSVTTAKIADGAITADKIADGTIIAADIAANTVTPAKLAYNAAGTILTTDGATVLWRAQSALAIANTQITGNIISSQITSVANTQVTGIMGVAQGGTASSTLTANSVLIGNGTSALKLVAPGTSGNVLSSDGTNWASTAAATSSGGASTVSQGTSLTLTSASNRVQVVELTAGSLSVTLPDATTLSAGGPTFFITNSGANSFTVTQNNGIVLATLTSGQSLMCEVYDTSTAAGKWLFSNKDIATPLTTGHFPPVTIDSTNAAYPYKVNNDTPAGNMTAAAFVDCLKLTSTTALLVWTRNGNKSVYGVVATNTSGVISYGTIVQIYDGSAGGTAAVASAAAMLLSGLTTGMVFIGRSATAVAVPFSISGSTITVGTVSANFGNKPSDGNCIHSVCVMSSTVMFVVYNDTTFTQIRVATMTYNGASAPTLGTPAAGITVQGFTNTAPTGCLLTLTSTTAQLWYLSAVNTWATRVITSNGASAPTLGTAITATVSAPTYGPYHDNCWQPYAYSATETSIIFIPDLDGPVYVASYTISGTTVTQTVAPALMTNVNQLGLCSRIEWINSTTGIFYWAYRYLYRSRYDFALSKLYQATYTPSGGTILYVPIGNTPDPNVYTYSAGMCLLSSTTGIFAGYNSTTGYISANVFSVL